MSKGPKKIPSFTLTELLVVMVISVVVVGLSFLVLGLLQKNVTLLQENYSSKTYLRLFQQQLAIDLHSYPKARYAGGSNELVFFSALDSVSYRFEEEYIIREKDTFSISTYQKEFYFRGDPVTTGIIDALKFEFLIGENSRRIFLYKRRDALNQANHGN